MLDGFILRICKKYNAPLYTIASLCALHLLGSGDFKMLDKKIKICNVTHKYWEITNKQASSFQKPTDKEEARIYEIFLKRAKQDYGKE